MTDIPRIYIEQQIAQIGIHTTNARVQVNTPRPTMRIVSEGPHMDIEHHRPVFRVVDPKPMPQPQPAPQPLPMPHHARNTAASSGQQGKNATEDGGKSHKSLSAPALQLSKARYDSSTVRKKSVRESLPSIEWEGGYINITWSKAQMQIEWDGEYMPNVSVEAHSVEIFLRERPYIKITVSDEVMAAMYGPHLDEQI